MRKPFKIGQKEYRFKKDAIAHYRAILNYYDFGQSLNDSDFNDLIDLLDYDYLNYIIEIESSEEDDEVEIDNTKTENEEIEELVIEDIKVARVQFNTKCFEVFYNDGTSQYISYLMLRRNSKNLGWRGEAKLLKTSNRSRKKKEFKPAFPCKGKN